MKKNIDKKEIRFTGNVCYSLFEQGIIGFPRAKDKLPEINIGKPRKVKVILCGETFDNVCLEKIKNERYKDLIRIRSTRIGEYLSNHFEEDYNEVKKRKSENIKKGKGNKKVILDKYFDVITKNDMETIEIFFRSETPKAIDFVDPPKYIKCTMIRRIRDTEKVKELKLKHRDQCQICRTIVKLKDSKTYSEGHHIRPLGKPHLGPDIDGNIIILHGYSVSSE